MPPRPVLIINPRQDTAFADHARRVLDDGAATPEALQAGLRHRYPHVVVRERTLSSEPAVMWYVYREGHWIDARTD